MSEKKKKRGRGVGKEKKRGGGGGGGGGGGLGREYFLVLGTNGDVPLDEVTFSRLD